MTSVLGLIGVSFIFTIAWVPPAYTDFEREYEEDLEAVNSQITVFENSAAFCPGASLALSCGDRNCERDKGEDESTCPTDCSTALLRSYNSQTFCHEVQEIFTPESYAEIQNIIRNAAAQNLRVRVVGKAHSSNSQLCTDGIIVSTKKLNRILDMESFEGDETILVEPGVTEIELTEWLHARGKSIGYGLVGYRGITVGGMVATGAHGSSPKHSALLSSAVKSITLVSADGRLLEFTEKTTDPELFKALRTHMGMFGVVVQMRLKLRSQFNLDTKIRFADEDLILNGKNAVDLVKNCDFGQIHWFPSTEKIMLTCGYETNSPAEAGAENIYLNPYIPSLLVVPYKVAFHYGACSKTINALFEKLRFTINRWQPPLVKENSLGDLVNSTHVIGNSHRILSSELGLGRETLIIRDWEVAIPHSQVSQALMALKHYMSENNLSLPVTGLYLRFTPVESKTLISNATTDGEFKEGEIVTFIEFPSYFPIGFSLEDREAYVRLYREMTRILIEQFHGRPHWGKNNEDVFADHKNIGHEQHLVQRFKNLVDTFDPQALFSNDFKSLILYP